MEQDEVFERLARSRGPQPSLRPARRRLPRWTPTFEIVGWGEPCDLIHIEDRGSVRLALVERRSGERLSVPLAALRVFRDPHAIAERERAAVR